MDFLKNNLALLELKRINQLSEYINSGQSLITVMLKYNQSLKIV